MSGRGNGLPEAERRPDLRLFALVKLVEIEAKGEEFEIFIGMRVEHQKEFIHHVLVCLVKDHKPSFEVRHLRERRH